MNALLRRFYPIVMHAIVGIVIASTVAILPLGEPATAGQIASYVLCFALGCLAALGMDRLNQRLETKKEAADAVQPQ